MNRYTNVERTGMHLKFGNWLERRRLYRESFPTRVPDRKTFQSIHQHLHETHTFKCKGESGKANVITTIKLAENMLNKVEKDAGISITKNNKFLNVFI